MKRFWKREKSFLCAVLIIVIVYSILFLTGIGCPIKFVTGISCAGCGMTRAWWCLLQGKIREAVAFHPLCFMVPVAVLWYFFRDKLPKRLFYGGVVLVITVFIAVYIVRMLNPEDSIVIFNPKDSIFFRLLMKNQ